MSTRRTEPRTWGTLDPRSFDLSVRATHDLVLASGDHTYQITLPTIPSQPRTGVSPAAPLGHASLRDEPAAEAAARHAVSVPTPAAAVTSPAPARRHLRRRAATALRRLAAFGG
ncbi:hypothetical protein [Streptomyces humi]